MIKRKFSFIVFSPRYYLNTMSLITSYGYLLSFSIFFIRSGRRIRHTSVKRGIFVFHKWLHWRAFAGASIGRTMIVVIIGKRSGFFRLAFTDTFASHVFLLNGNIFWWLVWFIFAGYSGILILRLKQAHEVVGLAKGLVRSTTCKYAPVFFMSFAGPHVDQALFARHFSPLAIAVPYLASNRSL